MVKRTVLLFFLIFIALHVIVFIYFSRSRTLPWEEGTMGNNNKRNHFRNETTELKNTVFDTVNRSEYLKNNMYCRWANCDPPFSNMSTLVRDKWIFVNSGNSSAIFSAYFVDGDQVVIIGAYLRRTNFTRVCQLWFRVNEKEGLKLMTSTVKVELLPEDHGMKYMAALFSCTVPIPVRPDFVSFASKTCDKPTDLIGVQDAVPQHRHHRQFTVCLVPLYNNYNKTQELIQWIEFNRILGAEKFLIYNISSAQNVENVLSYYVDLEIVEVVQWPLSSIMDSLEDIHYNGQVAALQDCLYRSKGESEYIVNIDLDEYIIPRKKELKTWQDIVKENEHSRGAYVFRNAFFRTDWPDTDIAFPEKDFAMQNGLATLLKVKRERKIWPPHQRSKYFAKTSAARSVSIHEVRATSQKVEIVSIETALLHHYRSWAGAKYNEKDKILDDFVRTNYAQPLVLNVAKALRDIHARLSRDSKYQSYIPRKISNL